jgi:dienelactone hydrolase
LIGYSRGAEGALVIASYEPHLFSAVVANSPSSNINSYDVRGSSWEFRGKPLPVGSIPVANIRIPVLLSDGGQDLVWPSAASAATIMQELRAAHDPEPYTNLYYPGAGHAYAGAPPYFPNSETGSSGNLHGGTEQANALAAEQFWPKMIQFINDPAEPLR